MVDDESPKPSQPNSEPLFFDGDDAAPNDQTQLSSDSTSSQAGGSRSRTHQTPQFWIGRSLGRYQIVELLGMGAMGVVYRAFDPLIERDVAIKILPPELAADQGTRNRFLAEAKAAGRLANPHVVALHEVGQQERLDYIVMELMIGGNLGQTLQKNGAFPPAEATEILADACLGLAAAHAAGMIHRDIKPSNLLRNADGAVKLADFGLAKRTLATAQNLTLTGQVVGTPYYMSPEQCQSKTLDARSDIYSLGATYYSLLTGVTPYHQIESTVQVMFAHVHGEPLDPRSFNPAIPEVCASIVSRATAKKPDDRYQSAADMHADLAAAHITLGAGPLSAPGSAIRSATGTSSQSQAGSNQIRNLKLFASLMAAGIIALAAWGGWFGFHSRSAAPVVDPSKEASAPTVPIAQGVTEQTITFGMSTDTSGPNRDFGTNMATGIRTAFNAVTEGGGINGRGLKLTILNDAYEPERTLANMKDLFEKRKVFAVIGNVGTATAQFAAPYAIEHRLLFFAPFSGANFLRRDPPDRYVFTYRPNFGEETSALVHYFVKVRRIPAKSIAVFTQDDAYGEEGFLGAARALGAYGVRPEEILRAGYPRNTLQVGEAVDKMIQHRSQIQAIVMVPTYGPAAQFIKGLKDRKLNVALGTISMVGGNSLAVILKSMGPHYGEGLVVTQVVPHYQSAATGVIHYREMMHKFHPEAEPGFVSLEGFIAAECLIEGLKRTGPDLTTESLITALESIRDLDLGIGPIISFGPSRHQASTKVWGTVLDRDCNFQNLDLD